MSAPVERARAFTVPRITVATTEERGPEQSRSALSAKVLITGTGRAGTTLLIQVLTDLGLDTGLASDAPIDDRSAAGLELPINDPNGPRIVKNPQAIKRLGPLLDAGELEIEHIIVPIRNLEVAAASRIRLARYGADLRTWGGLMGTVRATRQREALALLEYELLYTIARHELPHTLLHFPRFVRDWEYTYRKLTFLDPSIPIERWRDALAGRVRPELIHETPLTRTERLMTMGGTVYNRSLAYPVRNARKLFRGRQLSPSRSRED